MAKLESSFPLADPDSGVAASAPVGPAYLVGVDGGGSGCRVRLCDRRSRVLASAEGGAANVYLDFDAAIREVESALARAFRSAGLDPHARAATAAGMGLAGVSSPAVAARVGEALPGFAGISVRHDGFVACLGAHGGDDGGLVIAGTGSAALLRLRSGTSSFGGRGFLLGDDGSGAWIGRAIWRRALRAFDGLEPTTPLLTRLLRVFDDDPVAVIAWGRTAPSHAFAAYAPEVFAAAADHDPAGLEVICGAAVAIGELIALLRRKGAPRISLVGGLAAAIEPYLTRDLRAMLEPPLGNALDGALLLAERPTLG